MPSPAEADQERDELERLTGEFLDRRRGGEDVDLDAFAAQHPSQAEEIRALFPTMLLLEGARVPEPARQRDRRGRWHIVREIGRGGMGVVYLAEDPATGERAALKLVSTALPEAAARFRREAAAVSRVSHPGLCRVLEVAPEGGPLWLALELLEGETLADVLRRERRHRETGPHVPPTGAREFGPERWLAMGEQVAQALHAAHEAGLVHRDVKPANVMLMPDGRAVVLDFGLAHGTLAGEETRITHTGVPVGTPAYMSPEQVRAGAQPPDRRTDVYSLGATLYEAFTLEPPFPGPTIASLFSQILTATPTPLRQRDPALPRDLEVVLATALEKEPRRRYVTARHMAEDLARVRRGERVRARAAGPWRRLGAWAARNPRIAAASGALLLALVTGLVVALGLLSEVSAARDQEAAAGRRVRARALASASAEAQRTDAMLALLLAREAVRAERTTETRTQLHVAVHESLERARLTGIEGAVTSIAWDAGGRALAVGSVDGRARLFDADGRLRCTVLAGEAGARGPVTVALAPDGERLTTRDREGAVRLWASDGAEIASLAEATDDAVDAVFLADGTAAVARASGRISLHEKDGTVRTAWQVPLDREAKGPAIRWLATQSEPLRLHVLTRDLRAIAYDRAGTEVDRREQAVGARSARVFEKGRLAYVTARDEAAQTPEQPDLLTVVDADDGLLGSLHGAFDEAMLCGGDTWWGAWSARSGPYVVGTADGGPHVRMLNLQRTETPRIFCGTESGGRLLTARNQANITSMPGVSTDAVRLWTPKSHALASLTTADDVPAFAAFSPDGERLALGGHSGGFVGLHATAPVELTTEVPRWRSGEGFRHGVTITRDGHAMLAVADEVNVRWVRDDGSKGPLMAAAERADVPSRFLSHLPGPEWMLITAADGTVSAYDRAGAMLVRVPADPPVLYARWVGHEGGFTTEHAGGRVRFHAKDGSVLAERAGTVCPPNPDRGFVEEVAVSEGTGKLAVYGPDGVMRRAIDLDPDERAGWYQGTSAGPAVLLTGPPGSRSLATTCRYLDAQGRTRWQAPLGGAGMRLVAISPDAQRVAFVTRGGFSLRDAAGTELAVLPLPGGTASAAFDGRGKLFAAASLDGVVRVWDRDGHLSFSLPNQGAAAYVTLSEDGRRLATATSTMARMYTTDVDELLALAARRSTRTFTAPELARFRALLETAR